MKYALYGKNGPKVTLLEFVNKQDGQTNPKKWTVKPYCPACGAEAHAYDIVGALGFRKAEKEVAGERRPRSLPGFHHKDHAAKTGCPNYFPDDPRFADLQHHSFDVRIRERNLGILQSPEVKAVNGAVLRALISAMTQQPATDDDVKRMADLAKEKRLYNMEVLGEHPWLLPYLLVRLDGHRARVDRMGRQYKVTFESIPGRRIRYRDIDGEQRAEIIPEKLRLSFAPRRRPKGASAMKPVLNPRTKQETCFEVSKEASDKLARLHMPSAPPANKSPPKPRQMELAF